MLVNQALSFNSLINFHFDILLFYVDFVWLRSSRAVTLEENKSGINMADKEDAVSIDWPFLFVSLNQLSLACLCK